MYHISIYLIKIICIKPSKYFYTIDTPQLGIYDNMLAQSTRNIFNSTSQNRSYSTKRSVVIHTLQSLCSKLKFRSQTFYLALYLVDIIFINKNHYLNAEIVAVCCLLLSGTNIKYYQL